MAAEPWRSSETRWVAAERIGETGRYRQHPDSPDFDHVGDLMNWLKDRDLIREDPDADLEWPVLVGWGNPWYAVPTDSPRLDR